MAGGVRGDEVVVECRGWVVRELASWHVRGMMAAG